MEIENSRRYLVTGGCGCIGAWVMRVLADAGAYAIAFDLVGASDHRLRLTLDGDQLNRLVRVKGDVTSLTQLEDVLDANAVTHVIHLGALQVPACAANPPLGAAVNVVGTANVFEAVRRRLPMIDRVVYASSAAVYGQAGSVAEDALVEPETHYGVYKRANEGTAAAYWTAEGVTSIGVRPYVVYGAGRDQGLTSAPTAAMLAAARAKPFHIPWGGHAQFQYAHDVARILVAASSCPYRGALVANIPGRSEPMSAVVEAIRLAAGDETGEGITYDDTPLPFPADLEARNLEAVLGPIERTPLEEGIRTTMEIFRKSQIP